MTNLSTIGSTSSTASAVGLSQTSSQERPRFRAFLISQSLGYGIDITSIKHFTTEKTDSGEAGTFTLEVPLGTADGASLANVCSPMDIIAIFADRVTPGTTPPANFIANDITPSTLTYGAAGAAVTLLLANEPSCLFIGMVDECGEEVDFQAPSATYTISGRDLTKIFIENDTFPPIIDVGGQPGITNLGSIVMRQADSGTTLLKNVLAAFCEKNPEKIGALTGTTASNPVNQSIGKYGYPWNNFISTYLLNDAFLSLAAGSLPNYQVQSGSVWANLDDLRNFPYTRLFVNELGSLVFDDQFRAWGFGPASEAYPIITGVTPDDVRHSRFYLTDHDLITTLVVMSAVVQFGEESTATTQVAGRPATISQAAIQKYGFRFQTFISTWDPPFSPQGLQVATSRMGVLFELHNDLNRATLIVKGNSRYKVGTRILLQYQNHAGATVWGPRSTQIKPTVSGTLNQQVWYVTRVAHQGDWESSDWTTTLELRFPFTVTSTNT